MDDLFLEYLVVETDELDRIDRFLAERIESLSRSTIKKLIIENKVLVNQRPVKASYTLKVDDLIEVVDVELVETEIQPVEMDLDIVYEDDDVLVVNKPSGMVVHPAPGHYQDTLVNGLLWHINHLSNINGELRPGIVHRIDKDTSGLLMVAKNNWAHEILARELQEKKTKREYLALVEGIIVNKRGRIDAPIGRDKNNRLKMDVTGSGKEAITNFEVLEVFDDSTLVKCTLETGRTHQIRVHMRYINHPLVNDFVYGTAKPNEFGQFLHAQTIGFTHPRTHEWLEFSCDIPEYFQEYLENKRIKNFA
jgi:23S rRNA pseudouridine1911/1915/1917 synthase